MINYKREAFGQTEKESFWNQNKRKNKTEILYQKIKIPNRIVEKLISSLHAENIETLKDCSEIENFYIENSCTTGLSI